MQQYRTALLSEPRRVTNELYVGPQIAPEQMAALKEAGFASVINNRPDGEGGPAQPTSAELERAARDAGLTYRHLPVPSRDPSDADARRMVVLVTELPHPVYAFCRSGVRSEVLYRKGSGAG